MSEAARAEPSDDPVREATGRGWEEWAAWIADRGGAELRHPALVSLLRDEGGVESTWWQQSIAVGFERRTGRRSVGQTADGGFQIGVRKTIPVDPAEAWRRLVSPQGVRAWLGNGTLPLEAKSTYRTRDGAEGEMRVVKPGAQLRLTYRPEGWDSPSTIQVRILPAATGTTVSFHEERLPAAAERERRKAHFAAALDMLASLLDETD